MMFMTKQKNFTHITTQLHHSKQRIASGTSEIPNRTDRK